METKKEIKKYFYNKKDYEFRLSRGAKIELEQAQKKQLSKLGDADPEVANIMLNGADEKEFAKKSEKEQASLIMKMAPLINDIQELNAGVDAYETGFILLKNNLKYKEEMTKDFFNEMVFNMEETMGFEETFKFFEEIRDNVFTTLEGLNMKETQEKKRKTNVKKNIN